MNIVGTVKKYLMINEKRKNFILLVLLFVMVIVLLFPEFAHASSYVENKIILGVAYIVYGLVYFLGLLLTYIISWLAQVASYNNFIDVDTVKTGWAIIRDLCNMFFVLVLLIISFATILRIESYNMKKWLPKLIIMSVLINFSRTICGIIIDFSQVIMLTFVNGFSGGGINKFVTLLGIDKLLSMVNAGDSNKSLSLSTLGGVLTAFFAALVAFIVILAMLAVLIIRVVMLWVYVILSPIAFLGAAFPHGQKYASQWWSEFSKQVIVGPLLAFFIWLALSTAGASSGKLITDVQGQRQKLGVESTQSAKMKSALGNEFFDESIFQRYIITIALLVGGLIVTQQLGGMAGSMAGKGMGAINKGKNLTGKGVKRITGYDYASGVAKNYMAARKAKRDDKIRLTSEKFARGIGTVKQKTIGNVGKGASLLNKKTLGRVTGSYKAEKLQKDINTAGNKWDETKQNIADKKDFTHSDGYKYHYSKVRDKWFKQKGGTTHDVMDSDKLMGDLEKEHEIDVGEKQEKVKKLLKRQGRVDKAVKIGLGLAGGVAGGFMTGGAGWLGSAASIAAGAAAGGAGVPKIGRTIRDAGKTDLSLASNYNTGQLNKEREENKLDSNDKILSAMNDSTKSTYERTAAAMEALSRKLVDLNTAISKRDEIKKSFGKDKRVMGQVEALLEKNYVGATTTFENLKSTKKEDREKAERTTRGNYENGNYTMKDLDNKSLALSIKQLALGLKTGQFVKQYKDLDASKQAAITRALKEDGSYEANEKLAFVKDIEAAFGSGSGAVNADKRKFTQSLNLDQISEILSKGTKEQVKALKDAINKDGVNLSEAVRDAFTNNNNRIAMSVKGDLGVT